MHRTATENRLATAADLMRGLTWLVPRLCGWPGRNPRRRPARDGEVLGVETRLAPDGGGRERIRYASDGLAVVGYRFFPPGLAGDAPVILYLRGGLGPHGEIAKDDFPFLDGLAREAGALVLAPQYRGNEGGEGEDRGGEEEAQDALRLLEAAAERGPVAQNRLGVLGYSRGGTTAFMAMRRGFRPRALATIGCITDTAAARAEGSWLLAGAIQVGTGGRPEACREAYQLRSPLAWPEEIPPVPLLAIVGTEDEVVGTWQSRRMVEVLAATGRPARLVEVEGGDHKLDLRPQERLALTVAWFREHLGSPLG